MNPHGTHALILPFHEGSGTSPVTVSDGHRLVAAQERLIVVHVLGPP
jgi:hypothetical protein